jgi:hypothetical protein
MPGTRGGSVFRIVCCLGNVSKRVLRSKSVNDIVKLRVTMTGLDPGDFSAQGLRSGYLTELPNRGIPLAGGDKAITASVGAAGSCYYGRDCFEVTP